MAAEIAGLEFEREFEFPPAIVFDALVDPELIAGWLGEASVDPRQGGHYDLVWLTSGSFPPTFGTITDILEPSFLTIATDNRGEVGFRLEEVPGGSRGTSTVLRVSVRVVVDAAFVARIRADWLSNLDQLSELLRGHPVDWANWDRDRAEVWRGYLDRAAQH
ncbi:MAG TPA: SRPBCC domain-containing protein [Terrimesophilobacter sp.]|jgi:Uncharacterized conserved protein|uniref:SRPBCC family protein n=1 Tax=Terrimesophilobacter sp. TaxID=2906435 RepID=UPI002F95F35C